MDLQYAPLARLLTTSRLSLPAWRVFPRFALMRRSIDAGLPAGAPISWDGLHNSAAGYDCVGRALARAIHAGGR